MGKPLRPNSTQVPDLILDKWMAELSGAEFKVVMYIVRRTYGFQKEGDAISLRQIVSGITKRDGTRLDSGTGLNKDTVCKALSSLAKRGLINRENRQDETGDLPNFYSLNLEAEGLRASGPESDKPTGERAHSSRGPVVKSETSGVGNLGGEGVAKCEWRQSTNPTQQQTELQQSGIQDTATTGGEVVVAPLPSASEVPSRGATLLEAEGFSKKDAEDLASKRTLETIRRQIEWLPKRKVSENRLGLLRRSIEADWQEPMSKKPNGRVSRTVEVANDEPQRELAKRLTEMYVRLENDAPSAFAELQTYIEEAKGREQNKPLLRESPRRLDSVLKSYETPEKRVELMVEFFQSRRPPIPELASLLAALKGQPLPHWHHFQPAA